MQYTGVNLIAKTRYEREREREHSVLLLFLLFLLEISLRFLSQTNCLNQSVKGSKGNFPIPVVIAFRRLGTESVQWERLAPPPQAVKSFPSQSRRSLLIWVQATVDFQSQSFAGV